MSRRFAAALCLPLLAAAGFPHAQGTCGDSYTVMRGDTLYSIARLCRSSVGAMARANRLADVTQIEVGQRLAVPRQSASVAVFEANKEEPARPPERSGYRMAPGDTLYSLARWARVSVRALLAANPGIDPTKVEIDDLVRLPAGARDPALARARERGRQAPPPRQDPPPPAGEGEDKPETDDEPDPAGM